MTLTDHLKNVCEHNDDSVVYYGQDFPLYIINRYFSFVSPAHANIVNTLVNYDHWSSCNKRVKSKLLYPCIPKMKYSYSNFKGYIKPPPKEKNKNNIKLIEFVSSIFGVSNKESEGYLEFESFESQMMELMNN